MKHGQRAHCVILCRDAVTDVEAGPVSHKQALIALPDMLAQLQGVVEVRTGHAAPLLASEGRAIVRELLTERQLGILPVENLLLVVCTAEALCHVLALLLQSGCTHFSPLAYLPSVAST